MNFFRFLYAFLRSVETLPKPHRRFTIGALAGIALAAFCVEIPFFHFGIPSGHDFEFHFNSWLEVVQHWKEGVLFPHWSALAHYGYGEARFIFYPPLSWLLGGGLGLVLPWKLVTGAYIWLALLLAGASMFALARRCLQPWEALFAALFYTVNPYHLVIVYWRSALAELLASAYIPLLLLLVLKLSERSRRVVILLGLVLAAGWLTNVPTAVMMTYSVAMLAVWVAASNRSWLPVIRAAIALVVGVLLAAVYLVPVLHQQSWASLSQVLSPGVSPQDNFLFAKTTDPSHDRFNLVVSIVAVWEMALVAALLFLSRKRRLPLCWPLLAWSAVCGILMFRLTQPLWTYLPELRYVQFPWRWLLCLSVALALLTVIAVRHWWMRAFIWVVALGSVLLAWQHLMVPWWDTNGDIQEMVDNQQDGIGNEGADEYVPATADPYAIDQNAPQVRYEGAGNAQIKTQAWESEERRIVATAAKSGKLVLHLFNYPSWNVEENGRRVPTETAPQTGQLIVPVKAGENRIQITYAEGWDRWLGGAISLATLLTLAFWYSRERYGGKLKAES